MSINQAQITREISEAIKFLPPHIAYLLPPVILLPRLEHGLEPVEKEKM
jgi:hypothetical protein